MNYEEFMKYVDKMDNNIRKKLKDNEEELTFYSQLVISLNAICEENQKQKEVIDKAIEYINKHDDGCFTDITCKCKVAELNITKLLDILKEVSK